MTSHDAFAAIGAITMLRLAWVVAVGMIARSRARRATEALIGCTYASLIVDDDVHVLHSAAGAESVITQRLPRGWISSGRVIDVTPQMEVQ